MRGPGCLQSLSPTFSNLTMTCHKRIPTQSVGLGVKIREDANTAFPRCRGPTGPTHRHWHCPRSGVFLDRLGTIRGLVSVCADPQIKEKSIILFNLLHGGSRQVSLPQPPSSLSPCPHFSNPVQESKHLARGGHFKASLSLMLEAAKHVAGCFGGGAGGP